MSTDLAGDGLEFVPAIMAGGGHRELWPLSRVNTPIQFLRDAEGSSPFMRWLRFFEPIPEAAAPVVVCDVGAISDARAQIAEVEMTAHIIVLPGARGLLPAVMMAALCQEERTRLVFADAAKPPVDPDAYAQVLDALAAGHSACGGLVMGALPVSTGADIRRGERAEHGGLIYPGPLTTSPDQAGYRLAPLWTARRKDMQKALEKADPGLAHLCSNLAAGASRYVGETWIDPARWSPMPHERTRIHALAKLPGARLRPVALRTNDAGQPVIRSNMHDGDVRVVDSRNCDIRSRDHLTVLVGCDNLRVVATPDATLVATPGREEDVEKLVDAMWMEERPEAFAHRGQTFAWGRESELFRSHAYAVHMLEIEPHAAAMPAPVEFDQCWTVAKGSAVVELDGEPQTVSRGETIEVPAETVPLCRNDGGDRLVVVSVQVPPGRRKMIVPPLVPAADDIIEPA